MLARGDSVLLDRLAADLDGGFGEFVRAHAGAVYSAALRLAASRADAEDIAQETFVQAYRALRRYDAGRVRRLKARPWLLAITLNLWRNAVRTAARRPVTTHLEVSAPVSDTGPGPAETADQVAESEYLADLVNLLPEQHRVPVVLRHVVGLSYREMAAVLECPAGTAKANVARGLARLRALAASPSRDAADPPQRRATVRARPKEAS